MAKPTVAVLGASEDRSKFGNKSVRAHLRAGYQVFPVNPRSQSIEGQVCFPAIADISQPLDRVSIYLPPNVAIRLIEEVAAVGPREVWLNPGTESPEILEKSRAMGLNVVAGCSIVDLGYSPSEFAD